MRDTLTLNSQAVGTLVRYTEIFYKGYWQPYWYGGIYTLDRSNDFCPLDKARSEISEGDFVTPTIPYKGWRIEEYPGSYNLSEDWYYYTSRGYPMRRRSVYSGSWFPQNDFTLDYTWFRDPGISVNLRHEATQRALSEIRNNQIELTEHLSELRATASMMRDQAHGLALAFTAFRKGNIRSAIRHLGLNPKDFVDTAIGSWLSLRFGWAPIVSDIARARDIILGILTGNTSLTRVKVTATSPGPLTGPIDWPPYMRTDNRTLGANAEIWFKLKDQDAAQLSRIGFDNWALTAWNAASYSFVIDYFVGVSNFLEAIAVPRTVDVSSSVLTEWAKGEVELTPLSTASSVDGYDAKAMTSPAGVKVFSFKRTPLTFAFQAPVIQLVPNLQQSATIGALISLRIR